VGFYIGLDLGQSADYSALAIVEEAEGSGTDDGVLYVRYLKRWPLRTPYPQIADDVAEIMNDEQLKRTPYVPRYGRRILEEPELLVDNYEHWREGDHDDLVLATALACWGARDKPGRGAQVYVFPS
jgi:hypothetical protein